MMMCFFSKTSGKLQNMIDEQRENLQGELNMKNKTTNIMFNKYAHIEEAVIQGKY